MWCAGTVVILEILGRLTGHLRRVSLVGTRPAEAPLTEPVAGTRSGRGTGPHAPKWQRQRLAGIIALAEREFLVTSFGDLVGRPPEMRAVAIVAQNPAHRPTLDIAVDAILPGIDLER
jgi:hypothetical protein